MAEPATGKFRRAKQKTEPGKPLKSEGARGEPRGKPAKVASATPKTAAKRPRSAEPPDSGGMVAEIRTLRAEKAQLAAELEAARARIAELEAARTDAINRIDWVIDSLQSLSGKKRR